MATSIMSIKNAGVSPSLNFTRGISANFHVFVEEYIKMLYGLSQGENKIFLDNSLSKEDISLSVYSSIEEDCMGFLLKAEENNIVILDYFRYARGTARDFCLTRNCQVSSFLENFEKEQVYGNENGKLLTEISNSFEAHSLLIVDGKIIDIQKVADKMILKEKEGKEDIVKSRSKQRM